MGQTHCVQKETCKKKTFLKMHFTSCISSVNDDDHNGLSSAVKRADCTAPEILGTSTNTVGPEIAGPSKNSNTTIGLEMVGPYVCADEVGLNENSVTKEMAGPSKITKMAHLSKESSVATEIAGQNESAIAKEMTVPKENSNVASKGQNENTVDLKLCRQSRSL
ncbi:hypothetical protein SKAU_G00067090 [Synaphobranchus kaupii]|uniref:Uncharacterized protein n=1 Tax=Synaphobranchus kaupii TaxID=118154 RepID=A0A9Q1G610_SYNKA|nr:hypothetical protein SKAU_G00067090 [Synaphobranchus kaupii]